MNKSNFKEDETFWRFRRKYQSINYKNFILQKKLIFLKEGDDSTE